MSKDSKDSYEQKIYEIELKEYARICESVITLKNMLDLRESKVLREILDRYEKRIVDLQVKYPVLKNDTSA